MRIGEDHWIEGAQRIPLTPAGEMSVRRCVVEHFTGGATAKSSITAMKERGVSAHVVIERDGTIYQCIAFNKKASHAGKSRWRDPRTGTLYSGANDYSIGIEIANAGNDAGALSWARKQPGFQSIKAKHRNGGTIQEWEAYPPNQIDAVKELTRALVIRYNLDDVTGHDCVAPERKDDPGPAFPMMNVRMVCGLSGLPIVYQP